jgi:hypothetical protein
VRAVGGGTRFRSVEPIGWVWCGGRLIWQVERCGVIRFHVPVIDVMSESRVVRCVHCDEGDVWFVNPGGRGMGQWSVVLEGWVRQGFARK